VKKVKDGVARFKKDVYPSHKALFERLSEGQDPEVLFITCSDSRIDTNLITQTQPGDLFIVRNAGNIVPPYSPGPSDVGTVASIEFAVGALKTAEIIVCGHTDCGAMKGALNPETLNGFPHVCEWLKHSEAALHILEDHHQGLENEAKLNKLIEENVISQLTHLRTYPFIASQLRAKEVNLHGWVYDIRSGQITEYNEKTGLFEPLSGAEPLDVYSTTAAA